MKLVNASFEVFTPISKGAKKELQLIEKMARICYKSEDRITPDGESARKMVRLLMERKHLAMIEHSLFSVKITTNRGVTHELVRHRLASYAQESTRYCNYSKDKFGNELTCIDPREGIALDSKMCDLPQEEKEKIAQKCITVYEIAEKSYLDLIQSGVSSQMARSVLPIGLKADIGISANYREWIHLFEMRWPKTAHPEMRAVMMPLYQYLLKKIPEIFSYVQLE